MKIKINYRNHPMKCYSWDEIAPGTWLHDETGYIRFKYDSIHYVCFEQKPNIHFAVVEYGCWPDDVPMSIFRGDIQITVD